MGISGGIEPAADGANHAIEHATGSNNIRSRAGMADTLRCQPREIGVVVEVEPTGPLTQNAAVAMVRVFAKAFISNNNNAVTKGVSQGAQANLNNIVIFQRAVATGILHRWDAE